MNNKELCHHGVKGQRWGVIRSRLQKGHASSGAGSGSSQNGSAQASGSHRKSVKDMSDEELRTAINRLHMEKQYREYLNGAQKKKLFNGKEFTVNILKKSGENILTQTTTYAMGVAINKVLGKDIVNPKKGQKDK